MPILMNAATGRAGAGKPALVEDMNACSPAGKAEPRGLPASAGTPDRLEDS